MKANRKFLNERDDAVSPVIAVILMVAITVVLAATVYVWVSGFGAQSGSPAKSIALTSNGREVCTFEDNGTPLDDTDDDWWCYKEYVVAAGSPGMTYADMNFVVNGVDYTFSNANINYAALGAASDPLWGAQYSTSSWRAATDPVNAGDIIRIAQVDEADAGGSGTEAGASHSGLTLRILDANANSIMLTLTVT